MAPFASVGYNQCPRGISSIPSLGESCVLNLLRPSFTPVYQEGLTLLSSFQISNRDPIPPHLALLSKKLLLRSSSC